MADALYVGVQISIFKYVGVRVYFCERKRKVLAVDNAIKSYLHHILVSSGGFLLCASD